MLDSKINLEYIGKDNDECQIWYDGEFLGSISNWTSLTESEQIRKVNDLVDQYSNAD